MNERVTTKEVKLIFFYFIFFVLNSFWQYKKLCYVIYLKTLPSVLLSKLNKNFKHR